MSLVFLTVLFGCTSSEDDLQQEDSQELVAEPTHIGGVPLELLKPKAAGQENSKPSADVAPWIAKRPHVHWLIDGDEVTRIDPPVEPEAFRIDFDHTKEITFGIMPYAFMTEKSRQIVVRRGDVAEAFTEPRISETERLTAIYYCDNRKCPRIEEVQSLATFPWDASMGGSPVCPYCGSLDADGNKTASYRFWMPQQLNMRDAMKRQIYNSRKRAKGQ